MPSVRDLLLTPIQMPTEVVALPELGDGVSVTVKGMSTRERGAFEQQFLKKGAIDPLKSKQARERMLIACCVDDQGNRMFTLDDVSQLSLQPVALLDRIYAACGRVNGINAEEDVEKNSEPTGDA